MSFTLSMIHIPFFEVIPVLALVQILFNPLAYKPAEKYFCEGPIVPILVLGIIAYIFCIASSN
jgi:hypothetical protein